MLRLALFALLSLLFATAAIAGSSVVGHWRTIDDETGKPKSIVEIRKNEDGELKGKVVEILHSNKGPNPLCEDCPGYRKGKPIKGMVILWGMEEKSPSDWRGGKILDPKNGRIYKAKLHLREDGKLEVRGFIGFSLLGRTQVWEPVD